MSEEYLKQLLKNTKSPKRTNTGCMAALLFFVISLAVFSVFFPFIGLALGLLTIAAIILHSIYL